MNRPHLLTYDIPKPGGVSAYPNPSDLLWGWGCVRVNQSDWLVMENRIPYRLLKAMTRAGCSWYCLPFDVSAFDALRQMALDNIRKEIAARLAEAEATRAAADEKFEDESDTNYRIRRRAFLAAARSIETRVTKMLGLVTVAAKQFDITAEDLNIRQACAAVELMGSNMRARAEAFATMHGLLTRKGGVTGQALANTIDAGETPPQIGADFLREIDEPGAADGVQSSFGNF